MNNKSQFKTKVVKMVKLIPPGKVVSYGQVALYIGLPRAARQVGWTLNKLGDEPDLPWWRVVNNQGRISIKGSEHSSFEQKKLLESEGLKINEDLTFDIEKYRFIPNKKMLFKLELEPAYLDFISRKIKYSKYFHN